MSKEEVIASIATYYSELPEACMHEFALNASLLELPKGHTLVSAGQYSDEAFYVSKGCLRAFYLKDGKDVSDWFAFENEFIASIQSYFAGIPSPHYIETLEPSLVLMMKKQQIDTLSDKFREFERLGMLTITQTMLRQQHRLASLQFETAQQKYVNLLAVRPDIEMRVPLINIASYLGITIETLSRIRHANARI